MICIAKLGIDIKDVQVLLNSEPHPDHGGGLTVLQQASAQLWASDASADSLASGDDDPDSVLPLRALIWLGVLGYPAASVDHRFKDGDTIRVGPIALTALALDSPRATVDILRCWLRELADVEARLRES